MECSIYHAIMTYQDLPAQELFEKLEELKPGLFSDLVYLHGSTEYGKIALLYIAYAYSKHSKLLVLGEQFGEEKKKIAEFVNMPDCLYGDVVKMQSATVREVILRYLEVQSDPMWQHMMRDKETLEALYDSSIRNMVKEDKTIDGKGLVEASKLRADLKKIIEEAEQRYREEYAFVDENKAEIMKMQKKAKGAASLRVEDSQVIK